MDYYPQLCFIGKAVDIKGIGTGKVCGHSFESKDGMKRHVFHVDFGDRGNLLVSEEEIVACLARQTSVIELENKMLDFFGGECGLGDTVFIPNFGSGLVVAYHNCYVPAKLSVEKKHLLLFSDGRARWFELMPMIIDGSAIVSKKSIQDN